MKKSRVYLIILLLAAVLAASYFIFFREKPAPAEEPTPTAPSVPLLPVYSPGPALENPALPISFSDEFSRVDGAFGLYRYDRAALKSDVKLYAAGDMLYLVGGGKLACINVSTGEHSNAVEISTGSGSNFCAGTLDDGRLWVAVMDSGIDLRIFDESVGTLFEYYHTESGRAPCWCAVSPDGSFAVLAYSGILVVYDLAKGSIRAFSCPCEGMAHPMIGTDRTLYAYNTDFNCTVSIGSDSGAVELVDRTSDMFPLCADFAVCPGDFDDTVSVRKLDGTGNGVYFPGEGFDGDSGAYASDSNCFLRISDGSLRLYDLRGGRLIRLDKCEAPGCDSAVVCSDFGWAAFSSGGRVYVFPTEKYISPDCDSHSSGYLLSLPRDECGRLAEYIYATHGVKCFWGEDGRSFETESFTAVPTDDADALLTLKAAAEFFDSLPEGMLREALAGMADGLCLYICRDLRTFPDLGWSASGFTDLCGDNLCIAMNTDDLFWMRGNLAHEFWHVLEYRVKRIEQSSGAEYISSWPQLMPEAIRSAYWSMSTDSLDSQWLASSAYCVEGESEPDRVWFVRSYSRSDPAEDRATVFETMIYKPELLSTYPHLGEKADRLCEILRFCYPSCSEGTNLPWESYSE